MDDPQEKPVSSPQSLIVADGTTRDWSRTIFVRVGPKTQPQKYKDFTVHEFILRTHSPFFNAALRNEWKEARERRVHLVQDVPEAFDLWLQWIYSRGFLFPKGDSRNSGISLLISAYILGDVLQDGDFRDVVIDMIIVRILSLHKHMRTQISHIYENTKEKDPLRVLAVDSLVYALDGRWAVSGAEKKDVLEEALWDVIVKACEISRLSPGTLQVPPFQTDPCLYHAHENGHCYRAKGRLIILRSDALAKVELSSVLGIPARTKTTVAE